MSKYLGDYDSSSVIYGKFTTYRPSTGAPFTLGGTPALSVYKDNSTTQSTTGVTLTADFDSVTGFNHFAIDTSADGTFYSSGSNFDIVITTGTVDSVSVVGSVVASFSIRKSSSLKIGTNASALTITGGVTFSNSGGSAFICSSTGGNGNGISVAGNGSGSGFNAFGGTTGNGITAQGGVTSGDGIHGAATTSGSGMHLIGAGAGADLTADVTGSITGNLSGSVGSVSGNVDGNVDGNVTGSVGSVATNGITAASLASDAITEIQNGLALESTLNTVDTNINNFQKATITKNVAGYIQFPMVLSTDHYTPATGKTVTAQRSFQNGAYTGVAGTISEIGSGVYAFNYAGADCNTTAGSWLFSATGCDDTLVPFITSE